MKNQVKQLGVIGDPISHSLSPVMQNAGLAHLKLPYLYRPYHVTHEQLEDFISNLKPQDFKGINVTIPHKQTIIPFVDSLSREAKLIGAINTIVVKGDKLIGHNTDARGYIESLKVEANYKPNEKLAILLGAGGAARAIAVGLGLNNAREVIIVNRTEKRAHELANELSKKFKKTIWTAQALDAIDLDHWRQCDLLINSTSMGLKGNKTYDLPLRELPERALVSDIVYNPLKTKLMSRAEKLGLSTHAGWGMLLHQGMISFELWTGKKAPYTVMKEALLDALKN